MVEFFTLSSFCPLRLRNSNFHTYFSLCFPHSCFISPVTTLFPFTLSLLPRVLWSFSHLLLPLCGSLTWFSQRPSHTLGLYWTASDVLFMWVGCGIQESRAQTSSLLLPEPHGDPETAVVS